MKKWENAEVEEVKFTTTEHNGQPSRDFDNVWTDENGAEHANFNS